MNVATKSEVWVLLLAVCLGSIPAQALAIASNQQPAGCHEHREKPPAQSPASYQCCLHGHDSAIMPAFLLVQPAVQSFATTPPLQSSLHCPPIAIVESLRVSSGDPPRVLPLRV